MFTLPTRRPDFQRGFSLIEVMIGAAIALIGMVLIFQVLAVWEERKRTTSAGSDAQVAGAIALYSLARDLRVAGYGFGMSTAIGCNITAFDTSLNAAVAGTAAQPVFRLYPVEILDGAGGAPDEIRVLYGNSSSFAANQNFLLSPTAFTKRPEGSRFSYQPGELVIVSGNAPVVCDLVEYTGLNANGQDINHDNGAYINYLNQNVTSRFNAPAGTGTTYVNGVLNSLGPDPRWNIWQIRPVAGGTAPRVLAWGDFLHAPNTWSEVAEGIINMQAQFGYDDDGDNMIDCPNTTGVCEWTTALTAPPLTAPINWTRVRAIRVALLARSQQYEKDAVTTTAPSWAGGAFVMTNVDGTADSGLSSPADPNDWRHYRYRVYQQVVPLRNMIWGTAP